MSIDLKRLKLAKHKASKSLLFFTRYFFKQSYGRKFVVNSHHHRITEALENVMAGETKRLIINIAPRYGKTELAVKNFIAHALAVNPSAKFIHLSYSDDLALDNSESIKDLVQSDAYQQLFPVEIKKDSKSKKKWYTTEKGGVYATASAGQVTGFGAGKVDDEDSEDLEAWADAIGVKKGFGGAIIIDDPIKPDDAESDTIRERVNNKFDSTIRNRVNSRNTPIIIIMQRLHPEDLCGYLIDKEGDKWEVLSLPCIIENEGKEEALWPFKHTLEELKEMRDNNVIVFDRQYMQDPKPREGLLYSEFKTYDEPPGVSRVKCYVDVADTGSDFLCSIVYESYRGYNYVLDVIYDNRSVEHTEPMVVSQLRRYNVSQADIESNNGGRGFALNVQRKSKEIGNGRTVIKWFHQTKNKNQRIFNEQANVNEHILFPKDWSSRWPKFYKDVTRYMAKGRNAHDDGPDVLTGIVEKNNVSNPGPSIRVANSRRG